MSDRNMKLTGIAYHRNGSDGVGFFAVTFKWRLGRRTHNMVATVFREENGGDNGRMAILDADMAADGNVTAGVNSWRYEDFDLQVHEWIRDYDIAARSHPLLDAALEAA